MSVVAFAFDVATTQLLLLVVELVLLVATFTVLWANRREARSREALIQHFTSVADVITRQEYFVAVIDTIQRAERSLLGSVTGSSPSSEEGEIIQQILDTLKGATVRGVSIRYLLPHSPDRLRMAGLYARNGADVKFNHSVLISDARYMCADGNVVLIGVPDRSGGNEPTRKGYSIRSETVSRLFAKDFEDQWNSPDSIGYEDYLRELVGKARASNPTASPELIATNLRIGKEDVMTTLQQLGGKPSS
jgi:hypothetical protein